jgi:hypothetical protein
MGGIRRLMVDLLYHGEVASSVASLTAIELMDLEGCQKTFSPKLGQLLRLGLLCQLGLIRQLGTAFASQPSALPF